MCDCKGLQAEPLSQDGRGLEDIGHSNNLPSANGVPTHFRK